MPSNSTFVDRLVGRDRRRTAVAGLLVGASVGVAYAAAGVADHAPGYVAVVAAGAVVAAALAAWNDGVATAVLAVVAPAFAWQYHHLATAVVTGSPAFDALGVPALVGVPAGLVAYGLGRVAATDGGAAGVDATGGAEPVVRVLVGSRPRFAVRLVTVAAIVGAAGAVLAVAAPAVVSGLGPVAATAPLVVLAAWGASRGSGLISCWLLVGVPIASVDTAEWVVADAQGGLSGAVGGVAFPAAVLALAGGSVAFAVGSLARRFRDGRASAAST